MLFTILFILLTAAFAILGGPTVAVPGMQSDARLVLFYLLIVYAMLRYPFIHALIFVGIFGLFWDILWSTSITFPEVGDAASSGVSVIAPPLGSTPFILALLTALLHVFTIPQRRLRWYSFTLGTLVTLPALLTAEYLFVTVSNGAFDFPHTFLQAEIWWLILRCTAISFIVAPLIYFLLQSMERILRSPYAQLAEEYP